MPAMNRRGWLTGLGSAVLGAAGAGTAGAAAQDPGSCTPRDGALLLQDFQPESMLHVPQTRILKPRFPAIDVHTHLTFTRRGSGALGEQIDFATTPAKALEVMDRKGVRAMVNLTGGSGAGLAEAVAAFDRAHPGRFYTCTEPSYARLLEPRFPQLQADAIEAAARAGARGLKILKTLGLFLRERIGEGPLVKLDDRRFDPMWEACAAHQLPVFIHVSDPEAFFRPVDCRNERWDELGHHPDWSFHGRDFPSHAELMAARDRVFARHPKVHFVGLHVGHDAENLAFVGATLDRFPNLTVELGARIGELGRQPRVARKFFDRYQDRILFGTDAVPPPEGEKYPQQVFKDELYEIYYRFLETEDDYFDYAPAPVPPQGRWKIYGLGLAEATLKKVYLDNAARVLGIESWARASAT